HASAMALGGKAESEMGISRYAEARRTLALAMRRNSDDLYLRGWLLHLHANIHLDLWEGKEAASEAREELRLGQEIQDASLIALASADQAGASFWTDFSN